MTNMLVKFANFCWVNLLYSVGKICCFLLIKFAIQSFSVNEFNNT